MGSVRMLFGQRSGFGRKTYECSACGQTARAGLYGAQPVDKTPPPPPRCPCGTGTMQLKPEPPRKRPTLSRQKPRWRRHLDMNEASPTCGKWSKVRP